MIGKWFTNQINPLTFKESIKTSRISNAGYSIALSSFKIIKLFGFIGKQIDIALRIELTRYFSLNNRSIIDNDVNWF